ncbi:MAG TPA: biopolymer transporter ExbD [Opitutales bacterium]|nr:biopolymer transporter ExbD [Opitutales bacterium]
MKFALPPPHKKARIEIIPLIDVIFFLLATFVLVSLSMTRLQGIELQLPQASSAPSTEQPEVVTVSCMADGNFLWDHRTMTWPQLLARMTQYRRESPDPRILINGEENADFGHAIDVLDNARKLGIQKVSIKTKLQPVTIE